MSIEELQAQLDAAAKLAARHGIRLVPGIEGIEVLYDRETGRPIRRLVNWLDVVRVENPIIAAINEVYREMTKAP